MPAKRKEPIIIDISIRFGRMLKEQRLKKGYTSAHIAEVVGMSQAGYSKIERGSHPTTLENATLACEYLGIALSSMIKRAEAITLEESEKNVKTRADRGRRPAARTLDKPTTQTCECGAVVYDIGLISRYWCNDCQTEVRRQDYIAPSVVRKREARDRKKAAESESP